MCIPSNLPRAWYTVLSDYVKLKHDSKPHPTSFQGLTCEVSTSKKL